MDFQITQPKLDLKPSFETDFESVGSDSYVDDDKKDSVSKSTEENQKAEENSDRRKRESNVENRTKNTLIF